MHGSTTKKEKQPDDPHKVDSHLAQYAGNAVPPQWVPHIPILLVLPGAPLLTVETLPPASASLATSSPARRCFWGRVALLAPDVAVPPPALPTRPVLRPNLPVPLNHRAAGGPPFEIHLRPRETAPETPG